MVNLCKVVTLLTCTGHHEVASLGIVHVSYPVHKGACIHWTLHDHTTTGQTLRNYAIMYYTCGIDDNLRPDFPLLSRECIPHSDSTHHLASIRSLIPGKYLLSCPPHSTNSLSLTHTHHHATDVHYIHTFSLSRLTASTWLATAAPSRAAVSAIARFIRASLCWPVYDRGGDTQ